MKKFFFLSSWYRIILYSLRLSPSFHDIIWFFLFHISIVQNFSLFQNSCFPVLPPTNYSAISVHRLCVHLTPLLLKCVFFQNTMSLLISTKPQITSVSSILPVWSVKNNSFFYGFSGRKTEERKLYCCQVNWTKAENQSYIWGAVLNFCSYRKLDGSWI